MTEELQDKELTDIKYLRARMTANVGLALDHAYNLGFFDGEKNVLDKIKSEIETKYGQCQLTEYIIEYDGVCTGRNDIGDIADILQIIDKYKTESGE